MGLSYFFWFLKRSTNVTDVESSPVHASHHLLLLPIEAHLAEVSEGLDGGHGLAHAQHPQVRRHAVVASPVQVPLS